MPNIIACYKWVLDEQDIKINLGTLELDISRAKGKISEYDRNAIEEAVLITEKHGGNVTALTFGKQDTKQSLKDALARGPAQAYWVNGACAEEADAYVTSNVLAKAVQDIGEYDIIICGEGSSDNYEQQIGPRLGSLLNIPIITFVSKLEIDGDKVVATRKLGDSNEVVACSFPVVITVLPDINKPRIPSLKQVMGASKKPAKEVGIASLGLTTEQLTRKSTIISEKGFVMQRKNILLDGTMQEKAAKLVSNLVKEGVL